MSENTAARSSLISAELEGQLRELLSGLKSALTIRCILDDGDKCREMADFLSHFASLSPLVYLELSAPGADAGLDRLLHAELLPATGVWNESGFCRSVFHGVPGGHELSSFVSCILAAGGAAAPLDKPTLRDIAKIKKPSELQICVSLGCQHCAKLVMAAQRIAMENELITAHMVDANLYPQIVAQYEIQRVPVVTAGGKVLAVGGMTLPELCGILKK